MENVHHSILGPPRTHGCAWREAAGQTPSQPQWDTGYGSGLLGHQEGGSSYYPHDIARPSHGAEPLPLPNSPTGTNPLRGISVMGWTKQNRWWRGSEGPRVGWMSSSACRWRYTRPSTHSPACYTSSSTTSASTLMLKSCKDLSLGEGSVD
jgi:hypothetical protein